MFSSRFISFDCSPYSEVQCLWHPTASPLPRRHTVAIPGIPVIYMFMSQLIILAKILKPNPTFTQTSS